MAQSITLLGEETSWLTKLITAAKALPPPNDPWAVDTSTAPAAPVVAPVVSTSISTAATAVTVPTTAAKSTLARNAVVGGVLVLGGYVVYTLLAPKKKAPSAAPISGLFRRRRR